MEKRIGMGWDLQLTEKQRQNGFKIRRGWKRLLRLCAGKLLLEQGKFSQARIWLQKAAMQKNQYAQYRLGKLLLIGADDVPKDVDAAIRHLKDSAVQGNQFAQYTLGKLYLLGHEVKADHERLCAIFLRQQHRVIPTHSISSTIKTTSMGRT
ncbi:MAG: tetratricopeptide repeat protein [Lachnospiraceae bacterium]